MLLGMYLYFWTDLEVARLVFFVIWWKSLEFTVQLHFPPLCKNLVKFVKVLFICSHATTCKQNGVNSVTVPMAILRVKRHLCSTKGTATFQFTCKSPVRWSLHFPKYRRDTIDFFRQGFALCSCSQSLCRMVGPSPWSTSNCSEEAVRVQ